MLDSKSRVATDSLRGQQPRVSLAQRRGPHLIVLQLRGGVSPRGEAVGRPEGQLRRVAAAQTHNRLACKQRSSRGVEAGRTTDAVSPPNSAACFRFGRVLLRIAPDRGTAWVRGRRRRVGPSPLVES
jgi:hypothetical protein